MITNEQLQNAIKTSLEFGKGMEKQYPDLNFVVVIYGDNKPRVSKILGQVKQVIKERIAKKKRKET